MMIWVHMRSTGSIWEIIWKPLFVQKQKLGENSERITTLGLSRMQGF